jgi:hypothetical protein
MLGHTVAFFWFVRQRFALRLAQNLSLSTRSHRKQPQLEDKEGQFAAVNAEPTLTQRLGRWNFTSTQT